MQTHFKTGEPSYEFMERSVNRCNEAAGGRLVIKLNPAGAIVPDGEELQNTAKGAIDMGEASISFSAGLSQSFNPFTQVSGGLTPVQYWLWLPWEGRELLEGLIGKYLPGGQWVSTLPQLGEVFAHSSAPIETVSDLTKLKFRGTGDGLEILARMGVPTVFLPSAEIYESMQRGVIDAFESNTFYVDWGRGHHEVADYHYVSASRAPMTESTTLVNKAKWDEIGPDLQQIVLSTFSDEWQIFVSESLAREGEYLQKYRDYGVSVSLLPAEVETAYMDEAKVFYAERRAEDPEYDEILASMFAWQKICQDYGIR
jgi:TRAP-type mannitol/chloroaromatic compound transport system substrate-binding protein